tara:strand:+ start:292 stop:468 length:177 start_codon:yes stop_codon:yes gene_type:complete
VNWKFAPGVVCVNVGFVSTPVHVEATPSIVTLLVVVVGDRLPDAVTPVPVAVHWYPVL